MGLLYKRSLASKLEMEIKRSSYIREDSYIGGVLTNSIPLPPNQKIKLFIHKNAFIMCFPQHNKQNMIIMNIKNRLKILLIPKEPPYNQVILMGLRYC